MGTLAWAEETRGVPRLNRIWFFIGADAGFNTAQTSVAGEENRSGLAGDVKGLVSWYQTNWVGELGLGLAYKKISGTRPTGLEGTLSIASAFLELGARWRLGTAWQLGPFLNAHLGADMSHRSTISPLIAESANSFGLMGGMQLLYETSHPRLPFRIGGRLLTDLNISNRQIYGAELSLHVGFSLSPAPAAKSFERSVDIRLARAFFKTDSWQISDASELVLIDLARILVHYRDEYTRIEVDGHTDRVGSEEYNQNLSEKRADAIGGLFISRGVPRERVLTHGYGFSRPLVTDGPLDQRRNRRVVLRLFGVQASSQMVQSIKDLMNNSNVPQGRGEEN